MRRGERLEVLVTKPKRYQRYSSQFKREAIVRASEEGMTDRGVCDELGVSTRRERIPHLGAPIHSGDAG